MTALREAMQKASSHLDINALKRRFQTQSVLAITLESDRIAVGLVRAEDGASRLEKTFSLPFGAESVVTDQAKTGAALAAQLEVEAIREKRCVVCVPPGWAFTASTDVPDVSDEDLRGYLELRAEREFPIPAAELRLAHCSYSLPGEPRHYATLAGVPAKRLEAVEKMLAAAGCKAISISLGLDRCLPQGGSPPAMHFLANGNHVDVVITAGGGVAALRSLAGPVAHEEAAFDVPGFSREIRITLGRLPESLRQAVREARFAGSREKAQMLCRETRESLHRLGIEPAAIDRGPDPAGTALDAAERHLGGLPVAFEFVTPEISRWQSASAFFENKQRRWMAAAGIGLIFLPLLIFFVRSQIAGNLEKKWNGMRRSVGELETLQQKIRTFRPWFEPAPQTVQVLESLITAFPEAGDAWAKGIQFNEGSKITCSGFARSQAALMALLDRLRSRPEFSNVQVVQVRGENPVQFSIACKWEPKHGP